MSRTCSSKCKGSCRTGHEDDCYDNSVAVRSAPAYEVHRAFETDYFQLYSNAPRGELVEGFGRLNSPTTKRGREGLEATPVTVSLFKSERSAAAEAVAHLSEGDRRLEGVVHELLGQVRIQVVEVDVGFQEPVAET